MRTIMGFLLVLLGLAFFLDTANVASFDNVSKYFWPIVVMVVGVLVYLKNPKSWVGPAIIFFIGLTMLAESMQWTEQSPWTYVWPVFIVIAGLNILFKKGHDQKVVTTTGRADSSAVFSGVEEKKTGVYEGGSLNAAFGGVKLDLREADIKDGAVIQIWAMFGGMDILVPRNVRVTTSVLPLFGGADNKTAPDANASKTLHIQGTAIFGGVGIKN